LREMSVEQQEIEKFVEKVLGREEEDVEAEGKLIEERERKKKEEEEKKKNGDVERVKKVSEKAVEDKNKKSQPEKYDVHISQDKNKVIEIEDEIDEEAEKDTIGAILVPPKEKVKFTSCQILKHSGPIHIPDNPSTDWYLTVDLKDLPSELKNEGTLVTFHPRQYHFTEVRVFFSCESWLRDENMIIIFFSVCVCLFSVRRI
jgi:hypothetical protein